jgi:hypothetical protein
VVAPGALPAGGGAAPLAPVGGAAKPQAVGPKTPVAGGEQDPYGGNETEPVAPGVGPYPGAGGMPGVAAQTNLLFRFFDFNVVPGKCYAYRVQLGLYNPNYKMRTSALKDPKLATGQYLQTKWSDDSDPAPVISVPGNTRILAVSVKPGRDPVGRVLVTKWSGRKGIEAHKEFSVVRGQVIDFPDETFKPPANTTTVRPGGFGPGGMPPGAMPPGAGRIPPGAMPPGIGPGGRMGPGMAPGAMPPGGMMPPGAGRMGPGMGPGGMPMPMPGGRGPAGMPDANAEFKVNYFTRAIALDFSGGELLRGRKSNGLRLAAPGEILLLDADGNLVVRDELDDKATCDQITASENAAAPDGAAPPHAGPAGGRGAMDKLFNHDRDDMPKRRPNPRGGP